MKKWLLIAGLLFLISSECLGEGQIKDAMNISYIKGPAISPAAIDLYDGVDTNLLTEADDLERQSKKSKALIQLTNNYIRRIVGDENFQKYYHYQHISCSSRYKGGYFTNENPHSLDLCQEYSVYYDFSYMEVDQFFGGKSQERVPVSVRLDDEHKYTKVLGDVSCVKDGHICDVIDRVSALRILKANGADEANEKNLKFSLFINRGYQPMLSQQWIWYAPTGEKFSKDCSGYYVAIIDAVTGAALNRQGVLQACACQ